MLATNFDTPCTEGAWSESSSRRESLSSTTNRTLEDAPDFSVQGVPDRIS
ncbi:MAG: hypothetical protein JO235_21605 [Chroococcidiopsidaceae cyanobacterium CP_BM_RX_35]|nr:hypothetical protein [Chroococcidiopsidaceae cyanobacterium CP_BM_RX_35]